MNPQAVPRAQLKLYLYSITWDSFFGVLTDRRPVTIKECVPLSLFTLYMSFTYFNIVLNGEVLLGSEYQKKKENIGPTVHPDLTVQRAGTSAKLSGSTASRAGPIPVWGLVRVGWLFVKAFVILA